MLDKVRDDVNVQHVMHLAFGRWRSQVLYAGVELGVFDELDTVTPMSASQVARNLGVSEPLLYRLLRALSAIDLLEEHDDRAFVATAAGAHLASSHPSSLRSMVLLEEGPEHYALWTHLPAMIRDGRQDAFKRAYGMGAFDYARRTPSYGQVFNAAMSSFSTVQSRLALQAFEGIDLGRTAILCDIAGGEGHLLCSILAANPRLQGIVFDLPEVVSAARPDWPRRMDVASRCSFQGGDMFIDVPAADAYTLKMILHDWNDEECIRILSNARARTARGARIFIVEHVVPGPSEPHFSKLYDVHMMCWGSGRERTEAEYFDLLDRSGWKGVAVHYPPSRSMGVIEGVVA